REGLARLYAEDQGDRRSGNVDMRVAVRDRKRRRIVSAWLAEGCIFLREDCFRAAMIFQHGLRPDDYRQAFDLARMAAEDGHRPAAAGARLDTSGVTRPQSRCHPGAIAAAYTRSQGGWRR